LWMHYRAARYCAGILFKQNQCPWMWSVDAKLVFHTQVVVTCKCLQKVSHRLGLNLTYYLIYAWYMLVATEVHYCRGWEV
jgi:hypothetical protein